MFDMQGSTFHDRLATISGADLVDTIGQLAGLECATHATLLAAIAELDRREAYRADGAATMADWLAFKLGLGDAAAREWARVARALAELPHIAEAYATARLSWDKVRALTKVATPETEAELIELAEGLNTAQVAREVRFLGRVTTDDANERQRARYLAMRRDPKAGCVRFSGMLPDADGETFITAIETLADRAPFDPVSGLVPSYHQRCADALVSLASGYLGGTQARAPHRPTVVVHVDGEVLGGKDGVAEITGGGTIAAETARRIACDSVVELVFDGRDGTPVGIGRRSRSIPPWLYRRLRYRDVGCRFPGCSRTRLVQAHHIHHWGRAGPTDEAKLGLYCYAHHPLFHEGGWSIRGDANGVLEHIRPDGTVLKSSPPKLRLEIKRRLLGPILNPPHEQESA